MMLVTLTNAQREVRVNRAPLARLAKRAVRRLRIRTPGTIAITFLGRHQIQVLNRRFLRHDRPTDVLSFRYNNVQGSGFGVRGNGPQPSTLNPEPIVGEIFIAPALARAYARRHGLSYDDELARYVVHGLLHWLGHDDATPTQRRKMRALEDALLSKRSQGNKVTRSHARSQVTL